MIFILIIRIFQNKHKTLGNGYYFKDGNLLFTFKTIELPWMSNERNISCIPSAVYDALAIERYSNGKFAIWLQDVPDRSEILIHEARFVRHLLGCIAPGTKFKDLDNDGIIDLKDSQSIIDKMKEHTPLWKPLTVEIRNMITI